MLANTVATQRHNRLLPWLVVSLIATAAIALSSPAQAAPTSLEQCFLDKINEARADEGIEPLVWAGDIEDYTRDHSTAMSGWGELIHSTGDALGDALPAGWTSWGENIGWQSNPNPPDCTAMHDAFMNSVGHRNNLLNPSFQFVATGTIIDADGELWTTHVFFSHPSYVPSFNGTFSDDDTSPFEADIEAIAEAGITGGCGGTLFCPNDLVTRAQMAAFLARALDLPAGPDAGFSDVGGTFEDDINAIASAGITQGCDPGKFCPNAGLTRAQMAAFLVRAFDLPPGPDAGFGDAEGHAFEDEINRIAAAGITLGCDGGANFCPTEKVTRGQMAAFLARALGL